MCSKPIRTSGVINGGWTGAKLVIEDEEEVLRWARNAQPNLVVIEESVSKSGLNQYFEETGEIPPSGVRIEPENEKFYIK